MSLLPLGTWSMPAYPAFLQRQGFFCLLGDVTLFLGAWALGADRCGFTSRFYFLTVMSWASYFPSLSLGFLITKMGINDSSYY